MILEMINGLESRLKELFPDYKIHVNDINILTKPSILIQVVNTNAEHYYAVGLVENTVKLDLIFFLPEKRAKVERWRVTDILDTKLLPHFKGENGVYRIKNAQSRPIDEDLHYLIDVDVSELLSEEEREKRDLRNQGIQNPNIQKMEVLHVRITEGGHQL